MGPCEKYNSHMAKKLTREERGALACLSCFLGRIGGANDAEDHGCHDEARRLREESCANIERLLRDVPFIKRLFPRLAAQIKDQSLFIVDWALIRREIDSLLSPVAEESACDEKGT